MASTTDAEVATGSSSGSSDPSAGGGIGMRMGFGQMGLVALGGMTSVAGAILIGTLWVQRRHRLTNGSGDGTNGSGDGS
jgi:hypothetical protein